MTASTPYFMENNGRNGCLTGKIKPKSLKLYSKYVPFCFSLTAGVNRSSCSLIMIPLANRLSSVSTAGPNEAKPGFTHYSFQWGLY